MKHVIYGCPDQIKQATGGTTRIGNYVIDDASDWPTTPQTWRQDAAGLYAMGYTTVVLTEQDKPGGMIRITQCIEYEEFPNYVSIFKSTGKNSHYYGPCQFCGEHVSEVWTLHTFDRGIDNSLPWTCRASFGHRRCLEAHIQALGLTVPSEPILAPAAKPAIVV